MADKPSADILTFKDGILCLNLDKVSDNYTVANSLLLPNRSRSGHNVRIVMTSDGNEDFGDNSKCLSFEVDIGNNSLNKIAIIKNEYAREGHLTDRQETDKMETLSWLIQRAQDPLYENPVDFENGNLRIDLDKGPPPSLYRADPTLSKVVSFLLIKYSRIDDTYIKHSKFDGSDNSKVIFKVEIGDNPINWIGVTKGGKERECRLESTTTGELQLGLAGLIEDIHKADIQEAAEKAANSIKGTGAGFGNHGAAAAELEKSGGGSQARPR